MISSSGPSADLSADALPVLAEVEAFLLELTAAGGRLPKLKPLATRFGGRVRRRFGLSLSEFLRADPLKRFSLLVTADGATLVWTDASCRVLRSPADALMPRLRKLFSDGEARDVETVFSAFRGSGLRAQEVLDALQSLTVSGELSLSDGRWRLSRSGGASRPESGE